MGAPCPANERESALTVKFSYLKYSAVIISNTMQVIPMISISAVALAGLRPPLICHSSSDYSFFLACSLCFANFLSVKIRPP